MLETQEPTETGRRKAGHDRWIEMQSAYAEYRRLSESLKSMDQSDDSSIADRLLLIDLERRQQAAFENYLDARMAYLEYRFDEANPPNAGATEAPGGRSWMGFIASESFLKVLAVTLICSLAFSFVHEQKRVRDLEVAQRELRTALNNERQGPKTPAEPVPTAAPQTTAPPAAEPGAIAPRPAARPSPKEAQRLSAKRRPTNQDRREREPSIAERASYNFSLGPSSRPRAVGPIAVVVRSIDANRKTASLSIVSDRSSLNARRVPLNRPLWIKYRQERVELRLDRIAGNRVDGRVIEYRDAALKLTASTLEDTLRDVLKP